MILIDAHSLIYRAFFALPPMSTSDGRVTNAVYGFTSMLAIVLAFVAAIELDGEHRPKRARVLEPPRHAAATGKEVNESEPRHPAHDMRRAGVRPPRPLSLVRLPPLIRYRWTDASRSSDRIR